MKFTSCKTKVLSAVLTLLLSVSEAGHSSLCKIWQNDIQKSENTVKVSRNYRGLWLSQKCEIHPGPRFVLRRYHIFRNGHFSLVRFYYMDPWCTVVSFSVTAVGSFTPPPEKATSSSVSWVVPGGLELDYTLRKVILVPFTKESARDLSMKANASRPSIVSNPWRPFKKYRILSHDPQSRSQKQTIDVRSINDMDCTDSLDLSFNELLLIRLEHRNQLPFLSYKKIDKTSEETLSWYSSHLYLGAEGHQRQSRPTFYQPSLLPSQTVQCPICHNLAKSSSISPPKLIMSYDSRPPDTGLEGQWISLRCEVRPFGLFLHRIFIFDERGQKWQAQHSYFKDPQCHLPMFTLRANGSYYPGPKSKTIADASEYDFHIADSSLTPEDKQFATNLNGFDCGPGSKWKVGQEGNLISSGGCKELGIIVPSVEQDLVRFENVNPEILYLYLGETNAEKTRPTSFQPPLVRCSDPFSKSPEDYFLNYNELHPLPLISGSLNLRIYYFEISFIFVVYVMINSFCTKI